jgi:shikimate kinase
MGAGKTTVGRALAAALDRPFVDNDELLRAATGVTAADLARTEGLAALHRWERDLALDAAAAPVPAVIAVAASLADDPSALAQVRASAFVVWLRADPTVLAARVPDGVHRPDLAATPPDPVARAAASATVADLTVDTGRARPAAAVGAIRAAYRADPEPLEASGYDRDNGDSPSGT